MMQGGGTLHIRCRGLPVVVEGSTPVAKVQYLHHHICHPHVDGGAEDHLVLSKVLGQPPIEQQQADFGTPLNSAHALLHQEDSLGPPCPLLYVVWGQMGDVGRIDEIRRDVCIDVEKGDEDGVETLPLR